MLTEKERYRILIVSRAEKMADLFRETFPGPQYKDVSCTAAAGDAKRLCVSHMYDILIINTPLADDFGVRTAIDLSEQHHNMGILLLVKNEMYEQVVCQVEDYGIIALPKPTTKQNLYIAVKMLSALQMKIKRTEKESRRLKEKMQELRTIDRAKWILVDQRKMSEPDAHRYIERKAMDRCVRKIEIAEEILKEM